MFTIEHGFEATSITLIDDTATHLLEDVSISAFDDHSIIEQWDAGHDQMHRITLSMSQVHNLTAALDLP